MLMTISLLSDMSIRVGLQLGFVCRGSVNKDVCRLAWDNFGVYRSERKLARIEVHTLRVDDWRHRENTVLRVVDDGVSRCVLDEMQVSAQMPVVLLISSDTRRRRAEHTSKMVMSSSAVCSVSRFKGANLISLGSRHMYLSISCVVLQGWTPSRDPPKRSLDSIQIMRSNSDKLSHPAQILM